MPSTRAANGADHAVFSLEQSVAGMHAAADFVADRVINREAIIHQAFLALLTGEHLLLQSRTGAGKTLLAEQVFAMFNGANIFKVQASKEQQPDTYFGGLDVAMLKEGKVFHNTEGSIVDCEFAFIDEIFDANDFTLRALLSVLNERALVRGVQNQPAKTHTVIAATNYLRVNEVTEAILDRFMFKAVILPDKNPFLQYRISRRYLKHGGEKVTPPKVIPFATLQRLNRIVTGRDEQYAVGISDDVLYFMNLVVRHYEYARNRMLRETHDRRAVREMPEYYVSPRSQAKALDVLRAIAVWNGRTAVERDDVKALTSIFATVGVEEEVQTFNKSYTTLVNTLSVSNGFEQLKVLLSFASMLSELKADPRLLGHPLTELEHTPIRRTFFDWLKDSLSGGGSVEDQNRRILRQFLQEFIPVCEEIRELKAQLEQEVVILTRS